MQEFEVRWHSEGGPLPEGSNIAKWQDHIDTASELFGKKLNVANRMAVWMREAGFEDVTDEVIKVKISPHAFCDIK